MNFKERLREEIEYKGLSVKELANLVNISYSTMLSYIDARGTLPNVETAVKIASVLGVTVEYLVNGSVSSNPKNSSSDSETFQPLERMEKDFLKIYTKLSTRDQRLLSNLAGDMSRG